MESKIGKEFTTYILTLKLFSKASPIGTSFTSSIAALVVEE